MKRFAYRFIDQVRREAKRRDAKVTTVSGGRERVFEAYDWGNDTFIFERGVWRDRPSHAPVLLVRKCALMAGREGRVMTVTSGSHATAAMPLLRGDFWNLGRVPERRRGEVMTKWVVCANVVDGGDAIEISQREVDIGETHAADVWLRGLGWPLSAVVLAERNDAALDFYRRKGQEWRIKPLVWTRREIDAALAASRTRIHTDLRYYHSVKGVHFLSYEDFSSLLTLCSVDRDAARRCIDEMAAPGEVGDLPALFDPKFGGHHEIELFGIRDLSASARIARMIAELQREFPALSQEECENRLSEIAAIYGSALSFPALADSASDLFASSMYKHLTGEIYSTHDQVVPAFDDRKTALPGATYRGGKPDFHPGADSRTRSLIEYVHSILSAGERMEYLNVYELRNGDGHSAGSHPTREIEFKTSNRPVTRKLIEKRLAQRGIEYATYMLVRVQAFQSLGVSYGRHHLLQRYDRGSGETYYFVRDRYSGYALDAISQNRFKRPRGATGEFVEFPEAVLRTAAQAGRAAAHTMIVKKYIEGPDPVHFGDGKEIIEFVRDLSTGLEMASGMRLCSVRGALGWPCIDKTRENLDVCFREYTEAFARTAVSFWRKNGGSLPLNSVMDDFCAGFVSATREVYWNYYNRRETFAEFNPELKAAFKFRQKWLFALWALERQYENADKLAAMMKIVAGRLAARADGVEI
ncbi:MAG: hypothetical protein IKH04_02700 [Kiritimatiellae bacterium]|nr:hypothetical protein [Kiritimatiellia bacterium]